MAYTRLEFGPLHYTAGWDITVSPGIQPAAIVVNFSLSELASLTSPIQPVTIREDEIPRLFIADCHLVRGAMTSGRSRLVRCTIQDRRWRWQFAYIDGVYNVPKNENPDELLYEKTPQELAALLLDAMGEVDYEVDALPNTERPQVNWQSARADQALMQLCGSLGCYPVLDYTDDLTKIHQVNTGTVPDLTRIVTQSSSVNVKPQPESIRVICGPTLFQTRLTLEMVAQDTDDSIKPWEEVSYVEDYPGGLEKLQLEAPGVMGGITGTYQKNGKTLKLRELAAASLYRIYRIKQQATGADDGQGGTSDSFSPQALIGTDFEPDKLEDLLPIRSVKLTTHTNAQGRKLENPATIHGDFNRTRLDYQGSETGDQYPIGAYSIDTARGLVIFQQPTFILEQNDGEEGNLFKPAELELETSYSVNKDGVIVRYEQFRNNSDPNSFGSFRLPVPDLAVRINEVMGQESDSTSTVEEASQGYLDAIEQRLFITQSQEILASRVQLIGLNGVVRQVTWSGGGGRPSFTRLSVNGEHNQYIPRFEKQLEQAQLEFDTQEAARLARLDRSNKLEA